MIGRIHLLSAFSAILLLQIQEKYLNEVKLARGNQVTHISDLAAQWVNQKFENSNEAAKNYGFFFQML